MNSLSYRAVGLTCFLFFTLILTRHSMAVTIETVLIGNSGNLADTRFVDSYHPNGSGAVAYSYLVGKTEVTNAQYASFLNSVASTDPYGLFNTEMESNARGGIARSGSPGTYTYAVKSPALGGAYLYDSKPVVFVSSGDAMRFANWVHNGQPSGAEDATTTEDGAYALNGAITEVSLSSVTRKAGARWWLPSENEWYKAAYYNPGTGTYFSYPTHGDSLDANRPSNDTGNSANYYDSGSATDFEYPLTDAGAYTLSGSPYGTFDQGGNVIEWNDTLFASSFRGRRGGSWDGGPDQLFASSWGWGVATLENQTTGFRVVAVSIPEPNTIFLVALGLGIAASVRPIGWLGK